MLKAQKHNQGQPHPRPSLSQLPLLVSFSPWKGSIWWKYGGSNVLSTYPNHASLSSHGEETTSALWDYFKKVCILPPFPLCRHWSDVVGLVKTKGKLNFSYPATYKISGYLDEGGGKNMHWTSIGAGPMERGPCKAVDTLALGLDSPKPPPLQYCVPVPSLLSGHPFWPRVPPDPAVRVC